MANKHPDRYVLTVWADTSGDDLFDFQCALIERGAGWSYRYYRNNLTVDVENSEEFAARLEENRE